MMKKTTFQLYPERPSSFATTNSMNANCRSRVEPPTLSALSFAIANPVVMIQAALQKQHKSKV